MGKPIGPILNAEFRIVCNKCAHRNQPSSCTHNFELETSISSLRRAVWKQQADTQVWGKRFSSDMDEVIGFPSQENKELDLEFYELENLVVAPPPSEKTRSSISKRLDFDAMSVDTQSSTGRTHPAVSNQQEMQDQLNEKASEADMWEWPFNEWLLDGCGDGF
jgi:hypothetical protein